MRVVFLGDSILGHWDFPGVVNRGIGWNTTSQMLDRFTADVLTVQPDVVLILGGTNDVRERWCFPRRVAGRITGMARIASAAGIRPIIGTIPPQTARYRSRIDAVNAVLRRYESDLADFHYALRDTNGLMRADFSADGVHPNAAGYEAMRRALSGVLSNQEQPSLR